MTKCIDPYRKMIPYSVVTLGHVEQSEPDPTAAAGRARGRAPSGPRPAGILVRLGMGAARSGSPATLKRQYSGHIGAPGPQFRWKEHSPVCRRPGYRARPYLALGLLVSTLMVVSSVFNSGASRVTASSHREAPLISADPQADNTDLYAFVSPDDPETVTIIASFYPGQDPAGGPNFYRFGDDVYYDIKIDRDGDAVEDLVYQFDFATGIQNPNTFLYNTGPIEVQEDTTPLADPDYNLRQLYGVTEFRDGERRQLTEGLIVPPANIGPASTPDYESLSDAGIYTIDQDIKVFAGPSDDPFWVDLGGIFDLLTIRTPPGNRRRRRRRSGRAECPHDRDADPDREADHRWRAAGGPGQRQRDHRRLVDRQPLLDHRHQRRRHPRRRGRSGPGLPPRPPAGQRGRRADRGEGPVQRLRARPMTASSWMVSSIRSCRACSTPSTESRCPKVSATTWSRST